MKVQKMPLMKIMIIIKYNRNNNRIMNKIIFIINKKLMT